MNFLIGSNIKSITPSSPPVEAIEGSKGDDDNKELLKEKPIEDKEDAEWMSSEQKKAIYEVFLVIFCVSVAIVIAIILFKVSGRE